MNDSTDCVLIPISSATKLYLWQIQPSKDPRVLRFINELGSSFHMELPCKTFANIIGKMVSLILFPITIAFNILILLS